MENLLRTETIETQLRRNLLHLVEILGVFGDGPLCREEEDGLALSSQGLRVFRLHEALRDAVSSTKQKKDSSA